MAEPGRERFVELARAGTVVPVWREVVADTLTVVGAFSAVVGDGPGFLLESVEHGERWSRWSFLGRRPVATFVTRGWQVEVTEGAAPAGVSLGDGALACLEGLLAAYRSPELPELPPLHGGIVGYLGYDVVREVEALGSPPTDDLGAPDAVFSVIGEIVAFDHFRQRAVLIENVVVDPTATGEEELAAAYAGAERRLDQLALDLSGHLDEPLFEPPAPLADAQQVALKRSMTSGEYRGAVEMAKEYIRAGDAFQIVLAQRFDVDLGAAEPFDVYRVLRQVNPSPYMFFLRQGGMTVVGASPEPMVQLRGETVISRPIAGTRRRGATSEEDRRLGAELAEHPKEVAEHVMLVDLARNDVGRVVTFGTEHVDELMTLERYSHVMHLTSQVSGALAEGKGPIDVLRATLPAGTVSGAPKVRAMEIIDELESTRRGPYAGTVGYLDFSGNLDTAIAIRTLVVTPDGRASVQAGAGIVVDSDPEAEDEECASKAAAILAAVAGAQRLAEARAAVGSGSSRARSSRTSADEEAPPGPDLSRVSEAAAATWAQMQSGVVRFSPGREMVLVSGRDAMSFMQGQLSQDISDLAVSQSVDSLLLSPQGKLVALVRATRLGEEELLLDSDVGTAAAVEERLRRFRLRVKAEISILAWGSLALRGPGAAAAAEQLLALAGPGAVAVPWDWAGDEGVDLLGPDLVAAAGGEVTGALAAALNGVPEADPEAVEAARIAAGVPRIGAELTEKTIPQEAGLVERAVSFDKGCYTGQELVARLDSRGSNVARRLCGVVFDARPGSEDLPAGGSQLESPDGAAVGVLTSVALSPATGAPVALAYAKRGVGLGSRCVCGEWAGVLEQVPLTRVLTGR